MPRRAMGLVAIGFSRSIMIYDIDPSTAEKLQFAIINRNFVHYPIAQHPNFTPTWRLSKSGKRLFCRLHPDPDRGGKRVILSLPAKAAKIHPRIDRAPNRFDIDVLLRLTGLTQLMQREERHQQAMRAGRQAMRDLTRHQTGRRRVQELGISVKELGAVRYHETLEQVDVVGRVTLRFASIRCLLRCLGRAPDQTSNRKSLKTSLQLWHHLRIQFSHWAEGDKHAGKRFVPLIEVLQLPETGHGEVLVRLTADYMATVAQSTRNFVKVCFPLVLTSEAALNLYLWLLAFRRHPRMQKSCPTNDLIDLCLKLGIAGSNLPELRRGLKRALATVNKNLLVADPRKTQYGVEFPSPDMVWFVKKID